MKMTNSEFAKQDQDFNKYCRALCVTPTTRQASKYRRKMGAVYTIACIGDDGSIHIPKTD